MTDWRSDRVTSALAGENPTVLAELDYSFTVIGDVQFTTVCEQILRQRLLSSGT